MLQQPQNSDSEADDDEKDVSSEPSGGDNNIQTFARMKPSRRLATNLFSMNYLEKRMDFNIPKVH